MNDFVFHQVSAIAHTSFIENLRYIVRETGRRIAKARQQARVRDDKRVRRTARVDNRTLGDIGIDRMALVYGAKQCIDEGFKPEYCTTTASDPVQPGFVTLAS